MFLSGAKTLTGKLLNECGESHLPAPLGLVDGKPSTVEILKCICGIGGLHISQPPVNPPTYPCDGGGVFHGIGRPNGRTFDTARRLLAACSLPARRLIRTHTNARARACLCEHRQRSLHVACS